MTRAGVALSAALGAGAVSTDVASTVFSGSMLLALPVAVLAGLVSFASPCVLPLVPGYIGYVTAMAAATDAAPHRRREGGRGPRARRGDHPAPSPGLPPDPPRPGAAANPDQEQASSGRVLLGVGLFIAGFTAVFVTLMCAAAALGQVVVRWEHVVTRALGVVVIIVGCAFVGAVPWLQREWRFHFHPTTAGLWGAPLLGVVFGLGWTPCMGPTLVAVQALSLEQASVARGAALGVAYCVGLGVPFVLIALGLHGPLLSILRNHRVVIMRLGGGLLIALGVALVTGWWSVWTTTVQGWISGFTPVI